MFKHDFFKSCIFILIGIRKMFVYLGVKRFVPKTMYFLYFFSDFKIYKYFLDTNHTIYTITLVLTRHKYCTINLYIHPSINPKPKT